MQMLTHSISVRSASLHLPIYELARVFHPRNARFAVRLAKQLPVSACRLTSGGEGGGGGGGGGDEGGDGCKASVRQRQASIKVRTRRVSMSRSWMLVSFDAGKLRATSSIPCFVSTGGGSCCWCMPLLLAAVLMVEAVLSSDCGRQSTLTAQVLIHTR